MDVLWTELLYFDHTRDVLQRGVVGHQLTMHVQTDQSVCSSFIPFGDRPNSTVLVLSASLFSPTTFKTKFQVLNELATHFYTVLKVCSRFSLSSTCLEYVSVVLRQFLLSPPRLQYNCSSYGINTGCFLAGSSFCLEISGSAHMVLNTILQPLTCWMLVSCNLFLI